MGRLQINDDQCCSVELKAEYCFIKVDDETTIYVHRREHDIVVEALDTLKEERNEDWGEPIERLVVGRRNK
jgi:hypothetical protein